MGKKMLKGKREKWMARFIWKGKSEILHEEWMGN